MDLHLEQNFSVLGDCVESQVVERRENRDAEVDYAEES